MRLFSETPLMASKLQRVGLAFGAGFALAALSTPAQAFTVYTSLPLWQAALSG